MDKILSIILTSILISCTTGKVNADENSLLQDSAASYKLNSAVGTHRPMNYDLDFKTAETFKTFDEFEMRGKEETSSIPCVYVWNRGDSIFVRSSNEQDSLRLYSRRGEGLWYSHMDYELWKASGYEVVKCQWDKMARTYDRYFYNDTILELKTDFQKDFIFKTIFVKTRNTVFELRNTSIDFKAPINNIRTIAWHICSGKMPYKSYCKNLLSYSFSQDADMCYLYSEQTKETYKYAKTPAGIWAMQPGLDETCLWEGQDIRNFKQ